MKRLSIDHVILLQKQLRIIKNDPQRIEWQLRLLSG